MSVLSFEYLVMILGSSFLSWFFNKKTRKYFILLANLVFLFLLVQNIVSVLYAIFLALFTWFFGILVYRAKSKGVLFLSIIVPVLGLVFFKYGGYLSSSIIAPLGLSFYTFKSISYLVDIYKKNVKAQGLLTVLCYVLFFPCFMAGPIHRSKEFFVELKKTFVFNYKDQKNGFILVALGLFEKLVIGDELYHVMTLLYEDPSLTGIYKIFSLVLYAFYIYVDFDSYSNIAIGASRMLGFHLKRNFHTPYLSVSIQDFWNRWHISLSTWLRDYIYIPLGGNRKGKLRKYLNVLIVFLVSGIWHGSTLMFVLWGVGHGIVNIIEDLIHSLKLPYIKALSPIRIIINFILVSILWIFFKSTSMSEVSAFINSMFTPCTVGSTYLHEVISSNELMWAFILLAIVIVTDICRYYRDMIDFLSNRFILTRWLFYILLIVVAIIFGVYGPGYQAHEFIYITF